MKRGIPVRPVEKVRGSRAPGHDDLGEHGGGGQPALNAILCIEELAKFSPIIAGPVFESNVGPVRVIDIFGTPEQKKAIIPVSAGGSSACPFA
jgi:butyryl-CoA dehydrogenase